MLFLCYNLFGGNMKIIKIGAMWCPACLITNKYLDQIVQKYNIEIENLPVLIFIKNDIEVDRLIGEKNYKDIEGVINKHEEV